MMTKEGSTPPKIKFMTSWAGNLVLESGYMSYCGNVSFSFWQLSSGQTYLVYSNELCQSLIAIVLRGYMAAFFCHSSVIVLGVRIRAATDLGRKNR